MSKEHFHNDTKTPAYKLVDGMTRIVNPGETLLVDCTESKKMVDAPKKTGAPGLADVQSGTSEEIKSLLPDMNEPTLQELLKLEQASAKPRTGLIKEIEAQILARKTG